MKEEEGWAEGAKGQQMVQVAEESELEEFD
jgi:hypothetical protein